MVHMPSSSEIYIWSEDQSYIYFYQEDGEKYLIRGKPVTTSTTLQPGEIFIQSATNNIRWRAKDSNQVYQAKGINLGSLAGKSQNEFYVKPEDKSLNISRADNRFLLSANRIRNAETASIVTNPVNIFVLLDVSGSMQGEKITRAKNQLLTFVNNFYTSEEAPYINIGFGVFGGGSAASNECDFIKTFVDLDGIDRDAFAIAVQQLAAGGNTPIAAALNTSIQEFSGKDGEDNNLILITDGQETCGGNVSTAAQNVENNGIKLKVIGIGLSSNDAAQFTGIADFFENANDAADLQNALIRSVQIIKNKIRVYTDSNRSNLINTIEASETVVTDRHYDRVYCTLEGGPGELFSFEIPTMYSGYTYNVSYDYGESQASSYSCSLNQSRNRVTDKRRIPTVEGSCGGAIGQDGIICQIVSRSYEWSNGGPSSQCNSDSDVGRTTGVQFWSKTNTQCFSINYTSIPSTSQCKTNGKEVCVYEGLIAGEDVYNVFQCRVQSVAWSNWTRISSGYRKTSSCNTVSDIGNYEVRIETREGRCGSRQSPSNIDGCPVSRREYYKTFKACPGFKSGTEPRDKTVYSDPDENYARPYNNSLCNDGRSFISAVTFVRNWYYLRSDDEKIIEERICEPATFGFVSVATNVSVNQLDTYKPLTIKCSSTNDVGKYKTDEITGEDREFGYIYRCNYSTSTCRANYSFRRCVETVGPPVSWANFDVTET